MTVAMTKGDIDDVTFFGRPVKPVSLGLTIIMVTLTVANLTGNGLLGDNVFSHVLSVIAFTSASLLIASWIIGSQKMIEVGLLGAAVVNIARSAFLLLAFGSEQQSVWLSLGVTIIAGGAYLLEKWDNPKVRSRFVKKEQ